MPNVFEILRSRGMLDAITDPALEQMADQPLKVYSGFDPTADRLHLGHLVAIMSLAWFQKCGHTPVAVVGGATGMVGDPSGKSKERVLLDEGTIQTNLAGITKNLEAVLDFDHSTAQPIIVNNYDWFKKFGFIEFLRDVGKHFRVGTMLSKESVKARLNSEEGISFTEFSYQLLQGYDFLHLFNENKVTLQMGGSDQWGNIVAGIDLIRRMEGAQAYGVTFPLLTRSDGKKFGKTEEGTIWLSPNRLSPYQFYQYLIAVPDADVMQLMRVLTFMSLEEIQKIELEMEQKEYVPNTAQKRLAEEVTRLVHGETGLQTALKVTCGVVPGGNTRLDAETLEAIAHDMPSATLSLDKVLNATILDLLVQVGLQSSKGEARRLVSNGGAYINNGQVDDGQRKVGEEDLIDGRLLLLAVGKKKKLLIRIGE
jgi:tyrosyl-tRNA synthetase